MPTAENDNKQRPAEFDALVLQFIPWLRKIANKLERNPQEREDIINETVAAALQRWSSYRPEGNFPGWLAFQMRERVRHIRRQRSVRAFSYDAPRNSNFDDDGVLRDAPEILGVVAPPQDNIVELAQVAGRLRGRGGEAVLRIAAGAELSEVAADFGVSRERVRQLAEAERSRLRKSLNTVRLAA